MYYELAERIPGKAAPIFMSIEAGGRETAFDYPSKLLGRFRKFLIPMPGGKSSELVLSVNGGFFANQTKRGSCRKTDGTPATKLGTGQTYDISPDGKWVLSILPAEDHKLMLIPTGAGEMRTLSAGHLRYTSARWLPRTQRVLVSASDDAGTIRTYSQEISGGELKPVSPPNVSLVLAAPDGKSFLGRTAEKQYRIYSLEDGGTREVAGVAADEYPIQWLDDDRTLLVRPRAGAPVPVYKVDMVTGHRTLWKQFNAADKVGMSGIAFISVSRDSAHYVYALGHASSVLYSVDGIR